jgi:hypothetical protein
VVTEVKIKPLKNITIIEAARFHSLDELLKYELDNLPVPGQIVMTVITEDGSLIDWSQKLRSSRSGR